MEIEVGIHYIGVFDRKLDLFEGQYPVNDGISYNSYIIKDRKIAVFDTVEERFLDEWMANLDNALGDEIPDYLIVQHMEPDRKSVV